MEINAVVTIETVLLWSHWCMTVNCLRLLGAIMSKLPTSSIGIRFSSKVRSEVHRTLVLDFDSFVSRSVVSRATLTHSFLLPEQKFAPKPLSQRGQKPSAEDSRGNAHTSRSSKSTTYSYSMQVCNVCVCMCEHVSACVSIVYTSAY